MTAQLSIQQQWQNYYQERIHKVGYEVDTAQLAIVDEFARIAEALQQQPNKQRKSGLFSRFLASKRQLVSHIQGLYLFGSVGRGKTFLMDMFCEKIGVPVQRLHFHHFMKSIHEQLKKIKEQENPLTLIAENFANQYRILCLDEFMVSDITDAMLLYGLLKDLTDRGVIIITTTNIPPDDLYKGGLQRARFLPAIELIKQRLVIHEIAAGQDFRRLCLEKHRRFFSPHNDEVIGEIENITQELSEHLHIERNGEIIINDRPINFIAQSQEVIWFQFNELCEGFRSQLDYIELARQFPVLIVTEIPVLDEFHEDAARRFLLLIDELYDRRIDLVLSSAVAIEEIYTGKKMQFEFERLQSRLFEMQSSDYGKV